MSKVFLICNTENRINKSKNERRPAEKKTAQAYRQPTRQG